MSSYAQTNLQLFNQLRLNGYTPTDLSLVRDAYELATALFTGRFQPSGKSFMAHVIGTASILASLRSHAALVAAGLLHNVYEQGDFGAGGGGRSQTSRREIRRVLSPEVEEYVSRFPDLHWRSRAVEMAHSNPDRLPSMERSVLLIRFADYLEHLIDFDVLYYSEPVRRYYLDQSDWVPEIAEKLGLKALAVELKQAIRAVEAAELPVELPRHRIKDSSFVIAPASCCKRFTVTFGEHILRSAQHSRQMIVTLERLYEKSPDLLQTAFREVRSGIRSIKKPPSFKDCLEARSDAFKRHFPKATLERVATGFEFTEGPVWIDEQRSLLFSDIPADRIFKLAARRVTVFRAPSGNSNGLTRDREGRLIACEHGNRRVTRTEKDGSIKALADKFQGKKLNSPNDVVVKSDGTLYFTDPSYGIKPEEQEQPVQGVYRLTETNEISLVADDFARPNGLAFSPDEKKLYIDDSERRHIRVFNVEYDGSLSGGSVFHDMNVSISGAPDGMKVDVEGRVYCTGAGGVWVFDSMGKHLGTIVTPEKPSNCAWGGDDWRSLYITAVTSVYKIRVSIPGIRVPSN
jgi:gluconolactonase